VSVNPERLGDGIWRLPLLCSLRDLLTNFSEAVASMRPKFWQVERAGAMRLPCLIEIDGQQRVLRRLVVVHPLWRADQTLQSGLGVAVAGVRTIPIDTFDLERRPLRALELVEERRQAPAFRANGGD
jgi:hypothetical protein